MSSVAPLHRTLEQELQALLRGASLECLVCGEFVLHAAGLITCPECRATLRGGLEAQQTRLQLDSQAG
jgi:Zn finger protein HypA/HybF involved in hydrogenase expression